MEEKDEETSPVRHELMRSFTIKFDEIKDSYNGLKQDLLDVIPIVKDFKGLLQRKPLFERSSFMYLSPLAKEIKAEIMREVLSRMSGSNEELKIIRDEVKKSLEEINEQNEKFNEMFKEITQENKKITKENAAISQNIDALQRTSDDLKEDLMLKAPIYEIARLVEKIATKSTIEELNLVKEQISLCPTSEAIEQLNRQLEELNHRIASFASKDMVSEMKDNLLENFDTKIEKYVNWQDLKNESERVVSLIRDNNSSLDIFKMTQEKATLFNKKEIEKIQKLLQSRPWIKDIDIVSEMLDYKANQKDLEKIKNDVNPKVEFFEAKVNLFSKRIEDFDKLLERYDEIILDKASKDDVSEIKKIFPKLLLSTDFDLYKEIDIQQKDIINEKLTKCNSSIQSVDKQIQNFSSDYKSFKRQFKEFKAKYDSIQDLHSHLESKADKSDIYAMFDYTARREEVKMATQAIEVFHKQLEMSVMFQLVTLKTMLKNNESTVMKNRQRTNCFNSLNSLMEWINHSIPPEIDKILDSARSVLSMSPSKRSDSEEINESIFPALSKYKKMKKLKISMTPLPDSKISTDF